MSNVVTVDVPLANVSDGQAFITPPWFRYLVGGAPDGDGTTGELLHGNSSGPPSWGPVDLAFDVTGFLPFANGGIGDIVPVSGGVLSFTSISTIASSPTLAANGIVFGGGAGATPSTPLGPGSSNQVLHGNSIGLPTWDFIHLDNLAGTVVGILPVANGGTGTAVSTGFGNVVLSLLPTIFGATLEFPNFTMPLTLAGTTTGTIMNATDPRIVSVGVLQTLIVPFDYTLFFVAHDKTSGGCSIGTMDAVGVQMAMSGIAGVTFTRAAASGLQAQVTAGASPRSLSIFAFGIGPI